MRNGSGTGLRSADTAWWPRLASSRAGRTYSPSAGAMAVITVAAAALLLLLLFASSAKALVPLPDPNEPNDTLATATPLENGVANYGALTTQTDKDYFCLDVPGSGRVTVHFVPNGFFGRAVDVAFRRQGSSEVVTLNWNRGVNPDGSSDSQGTVGPGRLFVIVSLEGGAEPSTAAYNITVTYSGEGTSSTQTSSTQTGSTQTSSTQTGSTQTGSTQTGSTQTGSTADGQHADR